MEYIEKADKTGQIGTDVGQARKIGKCVCAFRRWLYGTKQQQLQKQEQAEFFSILQETQSELNTIRGNLNFITEDDCAEICIYRLKAAELSLNRHMKQAKAARLTASPYREETV